MKDSNLVVLTKEKKEEMIRSIKHYFFNERDLELGDLASSLVLDFFIEELAPEFYNQGVLDSYQFMNDKNEDLLSILKE